MSTTQQPPKWPDGLVTRPIEHRDVTAWKALLDAIEEVDQTGDAWSIDDLIDELDGPGIDPRTGTVGVWEGDAMVACGFVVSMPNAEDVDRVRTFGGVAPRWRRRGLGTALLDWQLGAARTAHEVKNPDVPGELHVSGLDTNQGIAALAKANGLAPERYFFHMKRSLDGPVPERPAPDGLRMIVFDPAYDEATRLAHNQAFRDHWGFAERTAEFWKARSTGSRAFRPAMSHLLLDPGGPDQAGTVAAYVLGYEYEADTLATGVRDCYIGIVGTRREYRGRGAAAGLIAATLAAAQRAGFDRASLSVDAENPTGALGLYERLGFVTAQTWVAYARGL